MPVLAKICGINAFPIAKSAIEADADYLGFIFFPKSPRHLGLPEAAHLLETIRAVCENAPKKPKLVSVVVDPDDDLIEAITNTLRPDLIQLHGHESVARTKYIAERFKTPLIKAVSIASSEEVLSAKAYEPFVSHLLFDAKPPLDSSLPGGVGARFDWSLMAAHQALKPWFLAGGLEAFNVAEAINISKAPMVDVSSGVERAPGLKDPHLISQFLKTVKAL
jgi:phosphoribosylanthranilate isomerase